MNESNFQHILRVLNTNLNGKVKVMFALTSIKGVGRRFSNIACKKAEVDLNKRCARRHRRRSRSRSSSRWQQRHARRSVLRNSGALVFRRRCCLCSCAHRVRVVAFSMCAGRVS